MDRQTTRGLLHRLVFGRGGAQPERKEMTRGQQTAWIIAAILLVGFFAYNYMETRASGPCASVFETNPTKCQADLVMGRLGSR